MTALIVSAYLLIGLAVDMFIVAKHPEAGSFHWLPHLVLTIIWGPVTVAVCAAHLIGKVKRRITKK